MTKKADESRGLLSFFEVLICLPLFFIVIYFLFYDKNDKKKE